MIAMGIDDSARTHPCKDNPEEIPLTTRAGSWWADFTNLLQHGFQEWLELRESRPGCRPRVAHVLIEEQRNRLGLTMGRESLLATDVFLPCIFA